MLAAMATRSYLGYFRCWNIWISWGCDDTQGRSGLRLESLFQRVPMTAIQHLSIKVADFWRFFNFSRILFQSLVTFQRAFSSGLRTSGGPCQKSWRGEPMWKSSLFPGRFADQRLLVKRSTLRSSIYLRIWGTNSFQETDQSAQSWAPVPGKIRHLSSAPWESCLCEFCSKRLEILWQIGKLSWCFWYFRKWRFRLVEMWAKVPEMDHYTDIAEEEMSLQHDIAE